VEFLIDASLPKSVAAAIAAADHRASRVSGSPLADAPDERIASHARSNGMALITRDVDFADVRRFPPSDFHGIVVVSAPEHATASMIAGLVSELLSNAEVVARLPGRLAIVEFGRVRLRED